MKKLLFGVVSVAVCLGIMLSSCGKKEEKADSNTEKNTEVKIDSAVENIEGADEEEIPMFEYKFDDDEMTAVLVLYNDTEGLEELVLEGSVMEIKNKTVKKDDGTKEVVKVEEGPYTLVGIDDGVFMNNTTLKKVTIPDSVEEIGEACFQNCSSLEEVVLPASLKEIAPRLFYGCDALATLNIPEGTKTVGLYAFGEFFKQIPWYNAQKDEFAFVGDGVLIKYNGTSYNVSVPEQAKSVAYYAFMDTPATNIRFNSVIEDIDELAFYRTSKNLLITLPEGSDPDSIKALKAAMTKVETYELA